MRLTAWLDELTNEDEELLPSQRAGKRTHLARIAGALGVSRRRLDYLLSREAKSSSRPVKPQRRDRAVIVAAQKKARNWPE